MPAPLRIQPARSFRGGLSSVWADLSEQMPVSEWRTGVQYTTQCDAQGFIWGCSSASREDGAHEKVRTELGERREFYPATIGSRAQCQVAGRQTIIGDVVRRVATGALDRTRNETLAGILARGDVGRDDSAGDPIRNPNLVEDGVVPDGYNNTSPSGIVGTVQGIFDFACECWDQELVLHVPRPWIVHFLNLQLVKWDAGAGQYRLGDHLVSFDCYENIGPDLDYDGSGDPDQNVPAQDGTEVWIWATSRPLVGLDRVHVDSTLSDPRANLYDVRAEQGAIIIADPCCMVGAKARVVG